MARPSNTAERRQQIADALLAVMSKRGYEKATIAEVAKEAGLTPGLVHYHFETKQEILLAVVAQLDGILERRVEIRLARAEGPRAQLDAFIDAHLATGSDADPRAVASWVTLAAEAIRQPEVRAAYATVVGRWMKRLEALVRASLAEQGVSTVGARTAAAAVFASIQGYFVLSAATPGVTPEGSAAGAVKRMVEGLLARAER
jgi:TetR/AcrR family transcriptional repressor of bet genes